MSADELLKAAQLRKEGHEVALATIIHTRGHTPREVGARMLILRDGRAVGTIGGGCGESEVRLRALQVLDEKHPALHVVDLLDDPALEDGAVCGGKMEVWIEPVIDAPLSDV
jgi:xanthine dehydrogenase accessory factor